MAKYATMEQLSTAVENLEHKVFGSDEQAETAKAERAKPQTADGGDKPPH